jgi:very-short-patch-repair endonuclease
LQQRLALAAPGAHHRGMSATRRSNPDVDPSRAGGIDGDSRRSSHPDGADPRAGGITVPELATRQQGVVSREQLLALGVTEDRIDHWLRTDRLHALFAGVYLLGHAARTPSARALAATMAVRGHASHRTAAALWGLLPYADGDVDVLVPHTRSIDGPDGVRVHRSRCLDADELTVRRGVPLTTASRTIADCAGVTDVESLIRRATFAGLTTEQELEAYAALRRPGAKALRAALAHDGGAAETLSKAERVLLRQLRRSGLPAPLVNRRRGRIRPDFEWRDVGLVVELDSFAHDGASARRRDARRDTELAVQGDLTLRLEARDVVRNPIAAVTAIAMAYAVRREQLRARLRPAA